MKTIKILIAIFFIYQVNIALSQEDEITIWAKTFEIVPKNIKDSRLKFVNLAGDVTITANNLSKIIIEVDGIKPNPERAKGLKRIGPGGGDNTGVGLNIKQEGNTILLTGAVSMSSRTKYKISVPKDLKIYVQLGMMNNGDLKITGLNSDLELDVKNSDIKLKEVTGPTVISSLSGDIDIIFAKVKQTSPFSIKGISGDIDISLPINTPADLELRSMNGGVYSDFDLNVVDKDDRDPYIVSSPKIFTKLNKGGVKIYVKAISGNIYLRKKK
ncbi:MAG: DUF4097 family beta strand repeat-containing protein [Bacteroidota bacterium]